MDHAWFSDPNAFGAWYGAIVGGVGGTLCGILGGCAGALAPRGKGRRWILGGFRLFLAFGILNLLAGAAALLTGQPRSLWYPVLLSGVIFTLVIGFNLPNLVRTYNLAEERRIDAQAIREN